MTKDYNVDRCMLIFAFRYALGRQSTAPQIVVENIKANIDKISSDDIYVFIKEIEECWDYGMDIDKRIWMNFKDFLVNELHKRSN